MKLIFEIFSGKAISRLHLEVHRYEAKPGKFHWRIRDPGSSSHVYINGHIIPKKEMFPLNDNDLISIGGNFNVKEANDRFADKKKVFLYRFKSPNQETEKETVNEGKETSSIFC